MVADVPEDGEDRHLPQLSRAGGGCQPCDVATPMVGNAADRWEGFRQVRLSRCAGPVGEREHPATQRAARDTAGGITARRRSMARPFARAITAAPPNGTCARAAAPLAPDAGPRIGSTLAQLERWFQRVSGTRRCDSLAFSA